jgi:serine/threonine protein phosphatase PrpC
VATPVAPLVFEASPRMIPSYLPPSVVRRAHSGLALDWGVVPPSKSLSVYASTVRGQSHRYDQSGQDGEDAYGLAWGKDRLLVAVADGVSTTPGSGVTAERSVRFMLRALASRPLPASLGDWSALFQEVAEAMAREPRGGHTTLTVAAVTLDGRYEASIARVGDSPAMLHTGTDLQELFPTKPKDAVDVLPLHPNRIEVASAAIPREGGLLLCSDGIGDVLEGLQAAATRAAFAQRWRIPPPNPLSFARDLDYELVGRFDDKTAVMVWHR